MSEKRGKAIFLSYEGFGQSYLETLYLPILNSVKNPPIDFTVVQFAPAEHPQKESDRRAAEAVKIPLLFLDYRNSPPIFGIVLMILHGIATVGKIARREKIDFIHARTWIPGLIALGARRFRPEMKIIFDTDGFVPELRVESGLLDERGKMFKILKKIEKRLVAKADLILVRTRAAENILRDWYGEKVAAKIFVTPNGRDEEFYRPHSDAENRAVRSKYNLNDNTVFVIYVGTLSNIFLPERMIRLFGEVKKNAPDSFFLILSNSNSVSIEALARGENLSESDYAIEKVLPSAIPPLVSAADVGIAFRSPTLSNRGVSPLKVGEYLLCGTPAIVNSGAGDLETLFAKKTDLGFLLKETSDEEIRRAAEWIVKVAKPERKRFREIARRGGVEEFGLSRVKRLYETVYSKLLS